MGDEKSTDDDNTAIDWSETSYMLPESHLITEDSFNEHVWKFSYKEYFQFRRETCKQWHENKQFNETSTKESPTNVQKQFGEAISKQLDKGEQLPLKIKSNLNACSQDVPSHKIAEPEFYTNYHLLTREPKMSQINVNDRKFYHFFLKLQSQGLQGENHQDRFENLLGQIDAEQNEYQQFLHHSASNNMNNYLYLNENVKKGVVDNIKDAVTQLLKPPQKLFAMLRNITFDQLSVPANLPFTFVRRVHEEGAIPKSNLPQTDRKLSVGTLTPEKDDQLSDETIMATCTREKADVYMKHAALVAIMEGLVVHTREWLLSLEIKEVTIGECNKKILLFGDPLPRRCLSTREVNNCHYKNVLRTTNVSRGDNGVNEEDENLIIDMGEEPGHTPCVGEYNVHVNLFTVDDLNILLETNVDQIDDTLDTFQISPKCEYQYIIGLEQFSSLDLCRLWWDSEISNTHCIVCSRVDVWNDVVTQNDKYTRDILCPPACPYSPTYYVNHLQFLLNELRALPPGEYILEHGVGDNCVKVLQKNDNGGVTYDSLYKDVLNDNEIVVEFASPWLPIDKSILTDYFRQKRGIPCLFTKFEKRHRNRGANKTRGGRFNGGKRRRIPDPQETVNVDYINRMRTSYDDEIF